MNQTIKVSIGFMLILLAITTLQAQNAIQRTTAPTYTPSLYSARGIEKGKLLGIEFSDEQGKVISSIEPKYEDLAAYVKQRIGNIDLGESFLSARFYHDTEYIEVPVDPNDPTKVEVQTIVNDYKVLVPNKPLMGKLNGKWGVINQDGSTLIDFAYQSFNEYRSANWKNFGSDRLPVILLTKEKENTLVDAKGAVVIKPEQFPAYFSGLTRKADAIEMCFFGDYLLINEGGLVADSLIKVPAKKEVVKGKTVIKEPAYSFNFYVYKYGRFNVIDLQTGKKIWAEPKKNIEIKFKDPDGNELYESLNPRSYQSLNKYSQNRGLGLNPAIVEFLGTD